MENNCHSSIALITYVIFICVTPQARRIKKFSRHFPFFFVTAENFLL